MSVKFYPDEVDWFIIPAFSIGSRPALGGINEKVLSFYWLHYCLEVHWE